MSRWLWRVAAGDPVVVLLIGVSLGVVLGAVTVAGAILAADRLAR